MRIEFIINFYQTLCYLKIVYYQYYKGTVKRIYKFNNVPPLLDNNKALTMNKATFISTTNLFFKWDFLKLN